MRILITGGMGFVGRHFTERFLKEGHEVFVVDSLVPGTGGKIPEEWYFDPFYYGSKFGYSIEDCREHFTLNRKYDLVLHLAAIVGGRQMIEDKPIAVADDLSIDSMFWQWAVKNKPKKVITFSSSAAYPIRLQTEKNHRLLEEYDIVFNNIERPLGIPDMTYGWAKLTSEYLGRLAFEKHGILSVVYRPFSGYGDDQDKTYPFPAIMERVRESDGNIEVWGTGEQKRDFIHIDDCVEGVIKTMDKVNDGSAINLSTGIYTSFKMMIMIAASQLGKKINIISPLNDKPEGVFARAGSITKQKKLGFHYKISLKEGIKRYYERNRNNNH